MVTEEELANMSPEEIAELQKQQCIFCHIISGKVASKKIFEDDVCLGILDINPANPGHILVLPKEHYQIMPQVPEETIGHMFMVVKHLSQAALKALKVEGVNIIIANGVAAGQKAPHFMVHIIPRNKEDGLKFIVPQKKVSDADLQTLHNNLKQRVNAVFGIEVEEAVVLDKEPEKLEEETDDVSEPEKIEEPEVQEAEFEDETEDVEDEDEVEQEVEEELDEDDDSDEDEDSEDEDQKEKGEIDLDQIAGLF